MITTLRQPATPLKQLTTVTTLDYYIKGDYNQTLLKVESLGTVGYIVFTSDAGRVTARALDVMDDVEAITLWQEP